jgi:hypothetical protein
LTTKSFDELHNLLGTLAGKLCTEITEVITAPTAHSPSFPIPTLSVEQEVTRPTTIASLIEKEDKDKEENLNISTLSQLRSVSPAKNSNKALHIGLGAGAGAALLCIAMGFAYFLKKRLAEGKSSILPRNTATPTSSQNPLFKSYLRTQENLTSN